MVKGTGLTEKLWSVHVYGLGVGGHDPVVASPTVGGAKYAAYRAAREAGYFSGRDGFFRFLLNVSARPATAIEAECAPRIAGRAALAERGGADPSPTSPKAQEDRSNG